MHQALHVDELVRNISHCVEVTKQGSASLLAFACCCKSFEGPVMDILWQRQADMRTILKTLPADSWVVTNSVFSLSRNLSDDEWQRFKKYTTRVITLWVPPNRNNVQFLLSSKVWVSMETVQLLGMESQRGGFWSRLRQLKCDVGWEIVPFMSFFLTPTITNLDLTLPLEINRLLQPTLSLLTHTCNRLRSLKLHVDTSGPVSCDEIARLISTSKSTLHRIEIKSPTPPQILSVILKLPQLRYLHLQNPRFPNPIPPKILSRLEMIRINGSHGSSTTQFLGQLSLQKLADVSISGGETIHLPPLLDSLHGASTTMKRLYLSPVTALNNSTTTLLRSFIDLTSLTIQCDCEVGGPGQPCSLRLTDEVISELGAAPPRISSLYLGPHCRTPHLVTFTSLIHLSRTCGFLDSLSIRVDFTSVVNGSNPLANPGPGANGARPPRSKSRLRSFTVGTSPIPDTPGCEWVVALALVSVFPYVQLLLPFRIERAPDRWEEVQRGISVCKNVFRITQEADAPPAP